MNITVIAVGKIREAYLKAALAEYSKRLSRYCRLNIIEVADERLPEQAGQAEEEAVRRREGERILKQIRDDMYVITLEIKGTMLSSEKLAARLEQLALDGRSNLAFVIGGSIGLGEAVLARSDYALSFSAMTFPHQLMRVILLEQIYRSFKINRGETYHK